MSDRVILITGANGGLGRAMARAFLEDAPGHRLFLGVRQNRVQAEALSASFPGRCRLVDLDVTHPDNWETVHQAILQEAGRLDVLVNNAGHHHDHLLATMPPSEWNSVLEANLTGVFHGCRTVLPTMISQRNGRIVNIASLSALLAPAGQTNYAAAKAGVVALTQSLAKEVARIGITVNALCPGYIDSEALQGFSTEQRAELQARIPMRRFGRPEEVAAAALFLTRPEAAYITGATLKIDGGIF